MRTLQTRTADMHDCQLGSVAQRARTGTSSILQANVLTRSPRHGGVHAGRLPLSLLALSHQPDVTHSNYTCAMLARPAHHAPRLDASRRTPGALHPEPKFNVLGHFADGLLF